MKYIRTKDGVYELKVNEELKAQKTTNYFYIQHKGYGCNLLYDKQDLKKFKQADTIEELIECYVVIFEHQDRPLIVFKNEIEHYKHCFVNKVKSNDCVLAIYGSFWVGADLLSKAKMNDKGDLELL